MCILKRGYYFNSDETFNIKARREKYRFLARTKQRYTHLKVIITIKTNLSDSNYDKSCTMVYIIFEFNYFMEINSCRSKYKRP